MIPVIDIHCHIYPEKIAEKASSGISAFYDGIPVRHVGRISDLLESDKEAGIVHNVIFSVATNPSQVDSINNYIAKHVEESEGRFTGLGALHPDTEDVDAVLERVQALGLKGIKLHPDIHQTHADDPRYMRIYEACSARNLPVLIHCGDFRYDNSNPNRISKVLESFKELRLIGAHFGGWSIWEEAAEKLHKYDNLWVDSSSSFDFDMAPSVAEKLINCYGSHKVMFATDFPAGDGKNLVDYLLKLNISDEDKSKILFENAKEFFCVNF